MSEVENIIKKYMRLACPGCNEKLKVETAFSLQKHACDKCGTNFYVPEVFGDYQLMDIVANDETTSTHHARNLDTDKEVVIRRLRAEHKFNGAVKKTFFEESNKLTEIKIECLVKASRCGDVDGIPFLEYANYGTSCLKKKLRKEKLTIGQACYLFLDIVNAIEVCHEQSLVHGNLKPSNIRFDEHGNVRLLDFGMSAALIRTLMMEKKDIKFYSNSYYIAPETVKSGELTPVSDIYSLGAIFYEMITGKKTFDFMDSLEVMVKKQYDLPEPPNHLKPGIPPAINTLIMGMIDITPARRPQFIVQVVAIIQKVLEELDEKREEPKSEIEPEIPIDESGGYVKAVTTEVEKPAIVEQTPVEIEAKPLMANKSGVYFSVVFILLFVIVILIKVAFF